MIRESLGGAARVVTSFFPSMGPCARARTSTSSCVSRSLSVIRPDPRANLRPCRGLSLRAGGYSRSILIPTHLGPLPALPHPLYSLARSLAWRSLAPLTRRCWEQQTGLTQGASERKFRRELVQACRLWAEGFTPMMLKCGRLDSPCLATGSERRAVVASSVCRCGGGRYARLYEWAQATHMDNLGNSTSPRYICPLHRSAAQQCSTAPWAQVSTSSLPLTSHTSRLSAPASPTAPTLDDGHVLVVAWCSGARHATQK